jgi:hypothetical protein
VTLPDYWLPRPTFTVTKELASSLEQVFLDLRRGEQPADLPVPVWQFLCWLADSKGFLLHGSGDAGILEFEPRQSNDIDEFGNRKAVYAASDGIWPMFFAIVDRSHYTMTIVNAAIRLESKGKVSEPFYFFSLTDKVLAKRPWRDGFVYVLPREGFEEQRPYRLGSYLVHQHHWANSHPVTPLAKVRVSPADFPFLAQIRGQDDELLARRVEENPNGFPWVN